MPQKSVFFIGGGNMAAAIIGGMDKTAWKITVAEIFEPSRLALQSRFPHITTVTTPDDPAIKSTDVIMFAVKPQSLQDVFGTLSPIDFSGKTIVSIMAGITVEKFKARLKGTNITFIRCMPNTPLLVLQGVTGVYPATEQVKQALLGGASKLFYFDTEDSLDKVTAISGSGPAYFFAFIESLRAAGVEMGLPAETASSMAIQTALGAATVASTSQHDVSELRQQVTSKGGTTEAALNKFKENQLDRIVSESVAAALKRSHELAKL